MNLHTNSDLRHDFVLVFDVMNGNPNGDPDGGNLPRTDPETMQGLVTDVCLKRKIRNYIDIIYGEQENTKIYVQDHGIALNEMNSRAYKALNIKSTGTKQKRNDVNQARAWMCQNFFDIRMFGAVMSTGVNCGQVRGPVQLTFARSVDAIMPLDVTITRLAITDPKDAEVVVGEDDKVTSGGKTSTMGRKAIVPYGLYVGYGFYSPHLAAQTGVTQRDLELFWEALKNMWEFDRSASRGMMAPRGLYVFSHDNKLGRAPAHQLFERIQIDPLQEQGIVPRKFADYTVTVTDTDLPTGVTLTRLCEG
ncbi:MAG: type I-C CRISPR-associated protein Cas7/Csd2 [Leptolyngbyaceae cyanobacterium]